MLWLGRLFEQRYVAVRLTLVSVAGLGYLVLTPDGQTLSATDRLIAVGVLLFVFVGVWSPFTVACGVSVATGLGPLLVASDSDVIPAVALAWTMFELGMRRTGAQVWIGLAIAVTGSLLSDLDELVVSPAPVAFAAASTVSVPLLLGLYVRGLSELNRQSARRAAEEVERVRAEERTAIARELHDLVAHHVASIVLRVGVARNVLVAEDPRVGQVFEDVHGTASAALADLRRLVAVLRDPEAAPALSFVDPDGLAVALATAIGRSHQLGLRVDAELDPALAHLDARTALALLRLTQEGLANVARHAGTTAQARLRIWRVGNEVEFELSDSGAPGGLSGPGRPGHGLIGLRERVEVLGGRLQAGPAEHGWRLRASVPLIGAA